MRKISMLIGCLGVASCALAATHYSTGGYTALTPNQIVTTSHLRAGVGLSTNGYLQGDLGWVVPYNIFDITPSMIISSQGAGFGLSVMHPCAISNNTVSFGGTLIATGDDFGIGPTMEFNILPPVTIGASLLFGNNSGAMATFEYNF